MKYSIGIDIGGTSLIACIMDEKDNIIIRKTSATDKSDNGRNILPDVAALVTEMISNAGISREDCAGIGLGVPGAVLSDGTVNKCVNLGWGRIDAAAILSEATGLPAYAINDANAAALGESSYGAAKGYGSSFLFTLGTGVGGGLVIDGNIIPGAFGGAGEIGHILVNPNEVEPCSCGKRGCLEQYSSANGVRRLASRLYPGMFADTKDIYDAAREGDASALEITEKAARALAYGCSVVAAVADPDIFVFGGGMAAAGDILLDTVRKHYPEYVFHASLNTEFALASLGNDAGAMGAAAYAFRA